MKWNIVMDSSCDTDVYEHESDIRYETVPFVINVDGTDYVDTPDLDLADLIELLIGSVTHPPVDQTGDGSARSEPSVSE